MNEWLEKLAATKSSSEWNRVCDQVKAAHGGEYPDWWWAAVMQSGLAAQTQAKWPGGPAR